MKFFPVIIMLLLAACNGKPDKSAYFEGYVDYKIDVIFSDPKSSNDFKENRMRCYYKQGSFIKKIFGPDSIASSAILYHAPSKRFITMSKELPNHYFSNTDDFTSSNPEFKIVEENLQTNILGMECIGYKASYPMKGYKSFTANVTYYHAKKLPFDFSSFASSTNAFHHHSGKQYPYIALFYTEYDALGDSISYTAMQVVPTSLSDTLFTIPTDKPLIHL